VHLPILGWVGYYKVLQHLSTLFGLTVLSFWFVRWYESSDCTSRESQPAFSPLRKITIISIITSIALSGAVLRVVLIILVSEHPVSLQTVVGQAVVTLIAFHWWELIIYGLLFRRLGHFAPGQPFDRPPQQSSTISEL
jgi:hypothetical protein